jgi:hypothetical protein
VGPEWITEQLITVSFKVSLANDSFEEIHEASLLIFLSIRGDGVEFEDWHAVVIE